MPKRALLAINTALITLIAIGTLFAVESRSQDYDPQYIRDIAERQLRFGGSIYQNGIHNKGPLEVWIPGVVRRVFGFDGFWFGIAILIIAVAALLGWAGAHFVRRLDGPHWLAAAAFGCILVHFTLSAADYAGVLYSRNMTIGLYAAALIWLAPARHWTGSPRRQLIGLVLGGAAIGLAVQTLPTATLSAACLLAFVLYDAPPLTWRGRRIRRGWITVAAAAVAFFSVPVYYRTIGPWRDFWDGWWVYGRYMSDATGRSLANQLGLGWHNFYLYTRDHMPATLAIAGFIGLGIVRWRQLTRHQRALHVLLIAWWAAAWLEIILTQRYSSHYFAVTAFPTALMIAGCAVHLVALLARAGHPIRSVTLLPHLLIAISLYWSGTTTLNRGLTRADEFRGVHALAERRERSRDGSSRAVQALLDLTTQQDDPAQIWTSRPWWYLNFRRVSATRFIWNSFLLGEIYLGRTSPDYIIPGSWDRWAEDIAQTDPQVFIIDNEFPMPGTTPADTLLAERFKPVLTTSRLNASLTPTLIDGLTSSTGMNTATGSTEGGTRYLGDQRCQRIDIIPDGSGPIILSFGAEAGAPVDDQVVIADGQVVAKSASVEYMRSEAVPPATIRVVIGTSSAVVMFADQVVAALAYLSSPALAVTTTNPPTIQTGQYSARGECNT